MDPPWLVDQPGFSIRAGSLTVELWGPWIVDVPAPDVAPSVRSLAPRAVLDAPLCPAVEGVRGAVIERLSVALEPLALPAESFMRSLALGAVLDAPLWPAVDGVWD